MYRTRSLYTTAGFQIQQNLHWEMLTDDQCETLVATTIELLERTGIEILDDEITGVLGTAGCLVDGNRVRIPSAKSEWALRVAPSRVTLCDRNGKRAMLLEMNQAHYGPGYSPNLFYDQATQAERPFAVSDVETYGKLCQMLPNIDFAMAGGYPTDVDAPIAELHEFKALVSTTVKPIVQNVRNAVQAQAVIDMAATVKGGERALRADPFLALHVAVNEPLQISGDVAQAIAIAAKAKIPLILSNELVSGLTAPAESAGVMIVALANSIAGLLIAQVTAEGAPFITGGFFSNNDTVNGMVPFGSPEISLLSGGYANILRYLRIPSLGFAGATDSKVSDAQLGAESALSTLTAGLAGNNLIIGAGIMESGCASNPVLLVLVDEIANETRRIIRGVEMDEDRLSRGVIDFVKPAGNYLATKHTRYYFKSEQFWPTLMNRKRIDDWAAEGSLTLGQRTQGKAEQLLSAYELAPLGADVVGALDGIIGNANK